MTSLRAAAIDYANLGWYVLPLKPRGKTPLTRHGVHDATTDGEKIQRWWAQWPDANIGIACGPSRLVVVDLDGEEGLEAWRDLRQKYALNDQTVTCLTARGQHLYFAANGETGEIRNSAGRLGPHIDVRAAGGYVVAPPSVHPDGKKYIWEIGYGPLECPLQPFPAALVRLLAEMPQGANSVATEGDVIPKGRRNDTLTRLAGAMRRQGASAETILAALRAENARCRPPLEDEEVARIARSIARYPPQAGRNEAAKGKGTSIHQLPLTDAGNAELIALLFGDKVRYDHRRQRWLLWTDHRWAPDTSGGVDRLALEAARERLRASADIEQREEREKAARWALTSESTYRRKAALDWAKSIPPIADTGEVWDRDPWALGVPNGVVDLRTGQIRDGNPQDYITMSTLVPYDPQAACPHWLKFLEEIFLGDKELIGFIQRATGYSLTGVTTEQCLFILYGTGANGKTTFMNTLRHVLGDYAANAPFTTFEDIRHNVASNDVAALYKKRFVTSAETRARTQLNEARVKALTGGDPITARFLYREFFTYEPTFKIWLAVNHKPTITDGTLAFWRRIRLIPFRAKFTGDKADPGLGETLKAEAAGILAWAVEGCLEWQKMGLGKPGAVVEATEEYRLESDTLSQFLQECCKVGEGLWVGAKEIYSAYVTWCEKEGHDPMSKTALGRRLAERDFRRDRAGGRRVYRGLALLAQDIPI